MITQCAELHPCFFALITLESFLFTITTYTSTSIKLIVEQILYITSGKETHICRSATMCTGIYSHSVRHHIHIHMSLTRAETEYDVYVTLCPNYARRNT